MNSGSHKMNILDAFFSFNFSKFCRHKVGIILCFLAAVLLTNCVISKTVTPVKTKTVVNVLYIEKNKNFLNSNDVTRINQVHNAIVDECRSMGFKVVEFDSVVPKGARHILSYNATWQWDIVMFLETFEGILYDGHQQIETAKYDATRQGARLDKFGNSASKIRPLVHSMMANISTSNSP